MKVISPNKKVVKVVNKLIDLLNIKSAKLIIVRFDKIDTEGYMRQLEKDCYEVVIHSKIDSKEKLLTLAHELVHVAQHDRGDLRIQESLLGSQRIWKGQPMNHKLPYKFQPWEVEAFSLEAKLAKQIKVKL